MTEEDVIQLYNELSSKEIPIWIDGGWCVDALLGEQTREHPDLDIAIDRKHATKLNDILGSYGFKNYPRDDTSDWNYVLVNEQEKLIDIHVFEFDENGKNTYGVQYPKDSLTGEGRIGGHKVNCISPEWMIKFKTAYEPKQKDIQDVQRLAKKYGFKIPPSHR